VISVIKGHEQYFPVHAQLFLGLNLENVHIAILFALIFVLLMSFALVHT